MSKVQLTGSVIFDSQIKIHTGTENKDLSLSKEFKDHLEGEHRQNGAIDQGKSRKVFMKIKWTEKKSEILHDSDMILYINLYLPLVLHLNVPTQYLL